MKKYPTFQVEFRCDVCGNPMGNILVLSEGFWDPATGNNLKDGRHWKTDYADVRCDDCKATHGAFNEMFEDVVQVFEDPMEAEEFVKEHRKVDIVVREIAKDERFIEKEIEFKNTKFATKQASVIKAKNKNN